MPIVEKTAYIAICNDCSRNVQEEWTHFDKDDLISIDLSGDEKAGEYNRKTGEVYCFECAERHQIFCTDCEMYHMEWEVTDDGCEAD